MYSSRFGVYPSRSGMDSSGFDWYSTDGEVGTYLTDGEISVHSDGGETTCHGAEDSPTATTASTTAASSNAATNDDAAIPDSTATTTAPTREAARAALRAYSAAVAAYEWRAPAPAVRLVPVRFLVVKRATRPGDPPVTHRLHLAVAGVQPMTRARLLAVLQGLLDETAPETAPEHVTNTASVAVAVVPRRRRLDLADVILRVTAAHTGTAPRSLADFADDGLAWELRAMAEEREREAAATGPSGRGGGDVGLPCGIDVVVDDSV